jgi:outer membrane receptor protein involved in Fe transport
MNKRMYKAVLMGWASGAALLACTPALAAAPAEGQVEEVVVTAQKRAEPLQSVPLSISAVTSDEIQKRGIDQFTDYARTVPGLTFVDRGSGRNKITLRGVSTGVDQNHQSPVGIYIDETPVSYPNNEPDLRLFDVERVEVLRGPQGTLYGAGSMGGTIKIITNKPRLDAFEGTINALTSNTRHGGENYAVNGMVNIPLAQDKAALRVVGYYRDEAGFVDNVELGQKDVNDDETWGGRVSLKLKPTDRFDVTATAMYQHTDLGGTQEIDPNLPGLSQKRAVPETRQDELGVYGVVLHYDLGWADLTSSSSYLDRTIVDVRDVTAFLGVPVAVWLQNTVPDRTFAQEVRLASVQGGPFEWIGGVFYSKEKASLDQLALHNGLFGIPTSVPLLVNTIDTTTEQVAGFGELTYHFSDQLKLTGGLRAFNVKETFHKMADGIIAGGHSEDSGDSSESKINPKINLSWTPQPGLLFYVQAAQGFRVGGPNTTIPPLAGYPAPASYKSDSLWNYEVGAKTTLMDGKVTFNAAAFYIDWTDIQVTVTRPDGFSYIANGDSAVSRGLEAELSARPAPGVELGLSGAYTDAHLTADSKSGAGKDGDPIPAVPKLTWDLYGRLTRPISGAWSGFVQADLQHVGKSYNGFLSSPVAPDVQHAYELANLKIGAETDDLNLTLFVDNLFDKRAELYIDRTLSDRRVNINRPRTIGVSVTKNF